MAVWLRNADRNAVSDRGRPGTESAEPGSAVLASETGGATGAAREDDAPPNEADSVKSSCAV